MLHLSSKAKASSNAKISKTKVSCYTSCEVARQAPTNTLMKIVPGLWIQASS
jgi:hypothetical protein